MTVTLSQLQIASLLANAFFSLFPEEEFCRGYEMEEYPSINFYRLLGVFGRGIHPQRVELQSQKLLCIYHYFGRIQERLNTDTSVISNISYNRIVRDSNILIHNLEVTETIEFQNVQVYTEGKIEDFPNSLHVDFANRFVGGGVLSGGCVQEEILFVINPELICACLFTAEMDDNECLLVKGSERFSNYDGYGYSFKYSGEYIDQGPRNANGLRESQIIAIDATDFEGRRRLQYKPTFISREFTKAAIGFVGSTSYESCESPLPVATGNWGCGIFAGDAELKFILQWIACSMSRRPMHYFTFGDKSLADSILLFTEKVNSMTQKLSNPCWILYELLLNEMKEMRHKGKVFKHIIHSMTEKLKEN